MKIKGFLILPENELIEALFKLYMQWHTPLLMFNLAMFVNMYLHALGGRKYYSV